MKSIGIALLTYAQLHEGRYPDDLGVLVVPGPRFKPLKMDLFVCPNALHTHISDRSTMTDDEAAAWINAKSDYIYLGKGLTLDSAKADVVVIYEKPELEKLQGMNMLLGDGHVDFMEPDAADAAIRESQRIREAIAK